MVQHITNEQLDNVGDSDSGWASAAVVLAAALIGALGLTSVGLICLVSTLTDSARTKSLPAMTIGRVMCAILRRPTRTPGRLKRRQTWMAHGRRRMVRVHRHGDPLEREGYSCSCI